METSSQLIKKIKEGGYNNVYPIAYIDGIIDKESNEKLSDILIRYNNIMVPWQGDVASTRNRVPSLMRRQGIVITYITDLSEIVTEVYKGTVEDIKNNWADNINWELVPDLKFVQDNASKLPDGTITPEKLSPALQELISQSGSVVNMPDDEDLEQKDMVLKFKDRPYNSELASGKGYKILRKNWTNVGTKTINLLTQDVFNQSNTIYEIRYDFDLNGGEITLPTNSILNFEGGKLLNGTLIGSDSKIINKYNVCFENIKLLGSWNQEVVYSNWFDFSEANDIDNIINFRNMFVLANNNYITKVYIQQGTFWTSAWDEHDGIQTGNIGIHIPSNTYVYNSATICVFDNNFERTTLFDFELSENCIFEGGILKGNIRNHNETINGDHTYGIHLVASKNIVIKNITIEEFWSDGIDIQSSYKDYQENTALYYCSNIILDNVKCLNNGRQGLSIEGCVGLIVTNSEFSGTGSIKAVPDGPWCGIDVEPWFDGQPVSKLYFINCIQKNNKGDFTIFNSKNSNFPSEVIIDNMYASGVSILSDNVVIKNSIFSYKAGTSRNSGHLSFHNTVKNLYVSNCSFTGEIYGNGKLIDSEINNCQFDIEDDVAYSGYCIYFKEPAVNVIFKDNYIKDSRQRTYDIFNASGDITVINNKFFINKVWRFNINQNNWINNFVEFKANEQGLLISNTLNKALLIEGNTFKLPNYTNAAITVKQSEFNLDIIVKRNIYEYYAGYDIDGNNVSATITFDSNYFSNPIKDFNYTNSENLIVNSYNDNSKDKRYYEFTTGFFAGNLATNKCYAIKIPNERLYGQLDLYSNASQFVDIVPYCIKFGYTPSSSTFTHRMTDLDVLDNVPDKTSWKLNTVPAIAFYKDENNNCYICIKSNDGGAIRYNCLIKFITENKVNYSPNGKVITIPENITFAINLDKIKTSSNDIKPFLKSNGLIKLNSDKGDLQIYKNNEFVDCNGNSINKSGNTANRPNTNISVGFTYFDSTLNKPIYWTGSKWVDATGADV